LSLVAAEPLTEFLEAIRSPVTKQKYEKRLDLFLRDIEVEGSDLKQRARSFVKKAKEDGQWATQTINQYMRKQKERAEKKEIAEATVPNYLKPIRLLLEQNDVSLNWRKMNRRIPKGKSYGQDRLPTIEEIKAILAFPDRRIKPVVLVMVSSGMRVGAWEYMNWGDITPIGRGNDVVAAKVKVYAGTPDQYFSFITPEAYKAMKEYVDFRSKSGEKISPSSPAIRDLWFGDKEGKMGHSVEKPVRLEPGGVKRLVEDAIRVAGIRPPLEKGKRRHEFQALHGFRKFFKSVCERNMKTLHAEILLGHNIGLNANYYRPKEEEILDDYLKAVPELTILESPNRVATPEVTELMAQIADLNLQMKEYGFKLRSATAGYNHFKLVSSAYVAALERARKAFGEKRVDELLFSVISEQYEKDKQGKHPSKQHSQG
jgi:hypothetical protein